ncbi:MAG TPA: hypothetical protein VF157_01035 [Chloroflexota bacterium]
MPAARLNLSAVERSLRAVEKHWQKIDDELDRLTIGRKDTPFNAILRERMMAAYEYLDNLIAEGVKPFARASVKQIIELNELVHYGRDEPLRREYAKAIKVNRAKVHDNIAPVEHWYREHVRRGSPPLKLAAEVYVSVLGYPQLFVEGNHRTGSLIASWIDLTNGLPPFVLSVDNAIAYFAPSAEIKSFVNTTTWRGRARLPKYRKRFGAFWARHVDPRYLLSYQSDMIMT